MYYMLLNSINFTVNNIISANRTSFGSFNLETTNDSFEKQKIIDDGIAIKLGTIDFSSKAMNLRKKQAQILYNSAKNVNNYLISLGYKPCNNFLISNIAVNNLFNMFGEKAGARYLKNFNIIAVSPNMIDESERDSLEMLILHEQGHYLHQKKMSEAGLKFEPKQLLPEEKEIIKNSYIKLFGQQYNDNIDSIIDKCYLENNLEFVGWHFTFKNRGCEFGEDVDKIYQKYYGP